MKKENNKPYKFRYSNERYSTVHEAVNHLFHIKQYGGGHLEQLENEVNTLKKIMVVFLEQMVKAGHMTVKEVNEFLNDI